MAPLGWPAPFANGAFRDWTVTIMKLPLAVGLADASGTFVIRNEAFMATVGTGRDEGDRIVTMAGPANAAVLAEALAAVRARAEAIEVRIAFPERPQDKQAVLIQPVPAGAGIATVVSMRDIREQLRVEAQVAGAMRMQAVGQLAGGIAHDFNNILTAVLMTTDQLLARFGGRNEPEVAAALAEIRRNGMRAAVLVEQLLAFSRQQPQRQERLDVAAVVRELGPLVSQLVGPAIGLSIIGGPLRSAVLADRGQIEQVIVNLAVNARDAMAGNGRLVIRLADASGAEIAAGPHPIVPPVDHVRIDVIDTGSGISPEIAAKIFEPFFTTKPMGKGTGLGLSTVYGIVKQSGGFIFALPVETGGTMFSLYLPSAGALTAGDASPPPLRAVAGTAPARQRILLVEDDTAVRIVFERALRGGGHDVTAAAAAEPALELLQSPKPFDILVSDVMMPGIDGVELAARARALRPALPIILVSGYAEMPLHRAADAQGVRFLSKPFTLAELSELIAEAVLSPAHLP
jgi:two-component system cell cycle sensor histidine kinase/response regulator CckA